MVDSAMMQKCPAMFQHPGLWPNLLRRIDMDSLPENTEPCQLEEWRPTVPNPSYEASSLGRVRNALTGKVLSPFMMKTGYWAVQFSVGNRRRNLTVHKLVVEAFFGPLGSKEETRHVNGIKTDNRALNLCKGTHKENSMDRVRHGTQIRGEIHPNAKLTDYDVSEIRRLRGRMSQFELGIMFGVQQKYISEIQLLKSRVLPT